MKTSVVILRASLASRKDLGDGTLPAAQILWVAEASRRMTRGDRRLLASGIFRTGEEGRGTASLEVPRADQQLLAPKLGDRFLDRFCRHRATLEELFEENHRT